MKKLFSLLAIIGIILASNCSRIPENNDPIIGVWQMVDRNVISETEKETTFETWTFNDAYLGRYNQLFNQVEAVKTDFQWIEENNQYTLTYPGTNLVDQVVKLVKTEKGEVLQTLDGNVIALRH